MPLGTIAPGMPNVFNIFADGECPPVREVGHGACAPVGTAERCFSATSGVLLSSLLRIGQIKNPPQSLSSPNPHSEQVLGRRGLPILSAALLPSPFSGVPRPRQERVGPRVAGFCGRAWGVLGFRGGIGGGKAEGQV